LFGVAVVPGVAGKQSDGRARIPLEGVDSERTRWKIQCRPTHGGWGAQRDEGEGVAVMEGAVSAETVREALTPFLEPGEELRGVGAFQSGGKWVELPKATFFTMRNWWVGVTDRRLILARLDWLALKILPGGVFSVARENVVLKKDFLLTVLRIKSPEPKVPKRLESMLGAGFDKDEFIRALSS
jgi:hypothetical protein